MDKPNLDGQVTMSVVQLDKLRDELEEKSNKLKELEKNAMKVELIVKEQYLGVSTHGMGYFQRYVPSTEHRVINRELVGLDKIKESLLVEARREVERELLGLREQIRELEEKAKNEGIKVEKRIEKLKQGHQEEIHKKNNEIKKLRKEELEKNYEEMKEEVCKLSAENKSLRHDLKHEKSKSWWDKLLGM